MIVTKVNRRLCGAEGMRSSFSIFMPDRRSLSATTLSVGPGQLQLRVGRATVGPVSNDSIGPARPRACSGSISADLVGSLRPIRMGVHWRRGESEGEGEEGGWRGRGEVCVCD